MIVIISNRETRETTTIYNVRDITTYEHKHNGKSLILSDINHGCNTLVNLNEYELLSVSN